MQFLEYLTIVRRRWFYLALGLLVGLAAGFLTAPGASDRAESFQGTTTLLVDNNSSTGAALNLDQTALVVESGAVPQRVSQRLAESNLAPYRRLTAAADQDLRSLKITAVAATRESAAAAANIAAEELNAELTGAVDSQAQTDLAEAQTAAAGLQAQVSKLDQQMAGLATSDPRLGVLKDQRSAVARSFQTAQEKVQELQAAAPQVAPLRTLEAAAGKPAVADGVQIPASRPSRALLLGLFGLLLGIVGAVAAASLDKRIRNKEDAEHSFALPVIAEIPPLPSGTKGRELLVTTRPAGPFVEAHRALRTVVVFAAEGDDSESAAVHNGADTVNGSAAMNGADHGSAHVLLVTSPSAGEGKTTTTAHLAAVLAEFGKRVLVISADFRRPRIHEVFGLPREPGLSDVLDSAGGQAHLSDLQMATNFPGVHLLPSGSPVNNPAQLLTETRQLIVAARKLFDYILIDTPPLLVANDATELAAVADMVILMAKADRTSRDAARRATEILRRVDAPVLGVVIASAHDTPTAYGYYRYRYYADADQGGGRRARKKAAAATTAGADQG